jgi:Zn-dependent protease
MLGDPSMMVFTIAILILSVIVHEVAHGYAANALGDPTAKLQGRLTLNPLPHIDPIGSVLVPALLVISGAGILFGWAKPVPYNPYNLKNQRWGEAIVGSAGVVTNIALAILFAIIGRVSLGGGMEDFAMLAFTVAWVNLFLGLFNLIPFPPLDGFTVLRGILPYRMTLPLRELEMKLGGFVGLVVFLLVFSYVFAEPFFAFAQWIFRLLVGI